ncbi:ribokinase [Lactobacillus colini]|uniref:Ribokinase n=1 Tax=Lactobacillus colini TaxID=1819254 RepID=A0ABS4MFJ8_9LACO|nr:ribokinase [Lactobacillus colini]MBP2058465.1 ribokinase [Lactobacillus colini]
MTNKIIVVGSINVDKTLHIERIPQPGETLKVTDITQAAGGKGANQAVASKRSGAEVSFVGAVGDDAEGKFMLSVLEKEGIEVEHITTVDESKTGNATILLTKEGQNSILVYPGANQEITNQQINNLQLSLNNTDFIIGQFETKKEDLLESFTLAKKFNTVTILNPAPADRIDENLLHITDIIAPNETESELITGIHIDDEESMVKTGKYFRDKGVAITLITLGSKGVFLSSPTENKMIPAFKVNAKDTTAAGDTFIGAMASELKPDLSNIENAIKYGQMASSITVQNMGAIPSIPTRKQIYETYKKE